MKSVTYRQLVYLLCAWLAVGGCEAVHHLEKGELLVRSDPKFKGNKNLSSDVLAAGVLTTPNRRLGIPKLYLHMYNLGKSIQLDSSIAKKLYRKIDKSGYYQGLVSNWLVNEVGEAPKLIDVDMLKTDALNLQSIYFGEGFLNARVKAVVRLVKRDPQKADVTFEIDEGEAYKIRDIRYYYRDTTAAIQGEELKDSLQEKQVSRSKRDSTVLFIIREDRDNSLLQPGDRFNEEVLTAERTRIANVMRDQGYYTFGPEMVYYVIDTLRNDKNDTELTDTEALPDSVNPRQAPELGFIDTIGLGKAILAQTQEKTEQMIREERRGDAQEERKMVAERRRGEHPFDLEIIIPDTARVYYVDSVFVTIRRAGQIDNQQSVRFNLLNKRAHDVYGVRTRGIKPDYDYNFTMLPDIASSLNLATVARRIRQQPGVRYSRQETQLTLAQMGSLGLFRNTVITYAPIAGTNKLKAYVDAVLLRNYTFSAGLESFVSDDRTLNSNLPGFGATVKGGVQNLFGRAEQLSASSNGFVSLYTPGDGRRTRSFYQVNFRGSLSIPRFLFVEGLTNRDLLKFRPRTTFSLSYLTEVRTEYSRNNTSASWQYEWYPSARNNRSQITVTPLTVQLVNSVKSAEYDSLILAIQDPGLQAIIERDLQSRLSTKTGARFTYSADYAALRYKGTWFFRTSLDVGGNIPYFLDVLQRNGRGDGKVNDNLLGGDLLYGQFAKVSFEYKYHAPIGQKAALVSRIFVGVGRPYNYTNIIPFENRFFSGGASSVRGWQSSTLGPGTFRSDSVGINNLVAPGGEYALELNLEYRYAATNSINFALFLDAGNVWFGKNSGFGDDRALLTKDNLELGVAGGVGLRYDTSFFILRVDIGQQIYAPDLKSIVVKRLSSIGNNRMQFNIGIGYPF